MYINIDNLFKIDPKLLGLMLVLRRAAKMDVQEKLAHLVPDDATLQSLVEKKYVKIIKGKKGQSELERMRLDTKGTEYLNSLEEPMVFEDDQKLFDWLSEVYRKREKQIGNGKKTLRHIASFREKSGLEGNHLAFLCQEFINDDDEQEYSHKLENVFFKTLPYQTRFVLEESRLWKYYQKHKADFDSAFKKIKVYS